MNDLIEKARDVASACSPLIAKLLNDMADELEAMQSRLDESEALDARTKTLADEWIEWKGGECPVNPHQRVMVMVRDMYGVARDFYWHHCDDDYDIIAYKIIEDDV